MTYAQRLSDHAQELRDAQHDVEDLLPEQATGCRFLADAVEAGAAALSSQRAPEAEVISARTKTRLLELAASLGVPPTDDLDLLTIQMRVTVLELLLDANRHRSSMRAEAERCRMFD